VAEQKNKREKNKKKIGEGSVWALRREEENDG